ncbi:DUF6705 family protein [uncultured Mucilaginibacter sp.]|uniref:DUF6705 family protein n=1 Tax=uncultured Mucilaginibacter sp. TaxID=797541 RepID=UPI0026218FF2|nr:DUF6705 family protein [uncultured Mucilaginibacter sp.]
MKKLFIALLLTLVSFTVFAQLKPYQPNPVLDKFVGTWVSQTGKKTITITIRKIQEPILNSKVDFLVGYLLHKDNNEILEQRNTPVLTQGINNDMSKIFQDKVFFTYSDQRKHKHGKLVVTISDRDPDEFTTYLTEERHMKVNTENTQNRTVENGLTLPVALVFHRK